MDQVEYVVVGAGVIGLAVARALALQGREVIVLESAPAIGTEVSSRNSGVIHAGIYYPEGSVKARVCVSGKHALYEYCDSHGVPYRRCGKLIVATEEAQVPALKAIQARGLDNGVSDLRYVDAREAARIEPHVRSAGAVLSPSTGIIDVHAYMLALQGDAEAEGALFAFNAPFDRGRVDQRGIVVAAGGSEPMELRCRWLVNCAGLSAQSVAAALESFPAGHIPRRYLAKGNYFALAGRPPFAHLIYPMPDGAWLGLHSTLDLGGRCKFGPDIRWVDDIDYRVDVERAELFYPAIRRYWPDLPDGALEPDYTGIRPKLYAEGQPASDFVIQPPATHGIPGVINLFGIESPGLTSSLAIADDVAALVNAGR